MIHSSVAERCLTTFEPLKRLATLLDLIDDTAHVENEQVSDGDLL
jgi:hypothetical protein